MTGVRRIAMWSGPRNISTAVMRAFENRADTLVWDEPYYAAYLALTGLDHPMRGQVLAAGETDWREVERRLIAPLPGGISLHYQKHMTQHMLTEIGRGWFDAVTHCFLVRSPERVLASYAKKRQTVTLKDIGFVQQAEIFDQVCRTLGDAPPVIDSDDVLADPEGMLKKLCDALGIGFDPAMLSWPAGRRDSDGVWAAHWYGTVENSTGFQPASPPPEKLPAPLAEIAEAARPAYEQLYAHRLR